MGRPRWTDEPVVGMSVRLPESIHARLRAEADARVVGVNLLVSRAVEYYLDRLPPLDPEVAD